MNIPDSGDGRQLRATGTCTRCQRHTNDGLVIVNDPASGPGGLVLICADRGLCDRRRDVARLR